MPDDDQAALFRQMLRALRGEPADPLTAAIEDYLAEWDPLTAAIEGHFAEWERDLADSRRETGTQIAQRAMREIREFEARVERRHAAREARNGAVARQAWDLYQRKRAEYGLDQRLDQQLYQMF